jgi:hypothetical protein
MADYDSRVFSPMGMHGIFRVTVEVYVLCVLHSD